MTSKPVTQFSVSCKIITDFSTYLADQPDREGSYTATRDFYASAEENIYAAPRGHKFNCPHIVVEHYETITVYDPDFDHDLTPDAPTKDELPDHSPFDFYGSESAVPEQEGGLVEGERKWDAPALTPAESAAMDEALKNAG